MTPLYAGFSLSDECPEMAVSGPSCWHDSDRMNDRFTPKADILLSNQGRHSGTIIETTVARGRRMLLVLKIRFQLFSSC